MRRTSKMPLSSEVQSLVDKKKWQEAYNKADDSLQDDTKYFLVEVENEENNTSGFVSGTKKNYILVTDANKASYWNETDAKEVAKGIRTRKIKTKVVARDAYIKNVGTQGTEKGEVINLFLEERFKNVDITSIKDILHKQIEELGFSYNTNPFLQFLDNYFKTHTGIEESVMVYLNDLYADDVITTQDLQAKTNELTNTILFNDNLYKTNYEDAEFIVQAYKWLSTESNIKRYLTNPLAIQKYEIEDVNKITREKAIEIRNSILFKDGSNITTSEINSIADIQRELRFLEGESTKDVDSLTLNIDKNVQNANKWKELLQDKVSNVNDAQDLINYIVKEFKLL
jgi:hypothetical protein